ncbi:SDR family NAD(P)-dependent oxidoreductase [Halosquirtibacter xylanolyticus]|uniref:SDR family NAD(P)-dependent oxidoreductase n=1 Tax=Halosquirtibacter xylanolyticus TaxID=3374599 RepID=UPI00374A889A|nr:SDR family NAD(P)-dependent oxidoreductase [Prolixibacteraceae bacterium]
MKSREITTNKARRLFNCIWRQKSKTPVCPMEPTMNGMIIAITGGNRGIGLETTKGLIARGAEVIILARSGKTVASFVQESKGRAHFVSLDLADISSVEKTIEDLKLILNGRKIDKLINNAGIALNEPHRLSPQGYELTFAVNVLGHHALFVQCDTASLLSPKVQIIAVTGDLYIQAEACTPDYTYKGNSGNAAYARSKLGVMWWAYECSRLFPNYQVNIVHPGAVLTGLGGGAGPIARSILKSITLTPKEGAQMSLICATQPEIESGAYYHNTVGQAVLSKDDIALDRKKSRDFWNMLDQIYKTIYA